MGEEEFPRESPGEEVGLEPRILMPLQQRGNGG